MALQLGQIIDGKYKIVRLIGEGGMGAVYEGENVLIRRRVAIKLLHAGVAMNTEMVQRFEREAQVAGTVGNDHILEILDLGTLADGDRYMVMEYLDGETLSSRIRTRSRLAPGDAVALIRQVLLGLGAAHAAGIVHRDLKPDNIFILKKKVGVTDFVKIIDFGISKFVEPGGASARMTRTGALMGTPHYMAPEQATGSSEIDRRTDIYAVGIILYEAVTGRVPFEAETFNQLLFEIALAKIVPARELVADLDPAFDTIISKATARDPGQRFQTCEEFIEALEQWERSGAAVSVPPEASIEAIVAATVPRVRTGQMEARPSTGQMPARPSTGQIEATLAAPTDSVAGPPATAVSGPMPGQPPTVNTWASTSQSGAKPKGPPVVAATIAGLVLLLGGVAGVLVLSKRGPSPSDAAASVASAASGAAPPAVAPTAEEHPAPVVAPATASPSVEPVAAPAAAPAATQEKTPKVVAAATQSPHHQAQRTPPPKTPEKAPDKAPEKSKPKAINFGY